MAGAKEISIHALREEGDVQPPFVDFVVKISIHALREEGDFRVDCHVAVLHPFLSTPSARRATASSSSWQDGQIISIHALREEGDLPALHRCRPDAISIHALREEGDRRRLAASTTGHISIHALREEGDDEGGVYTITLEAFLSTPSARRATAKTEKNISTFVSL